MQAMAISSRVGAALASGAEGARLSREDALALMDEAPSAPLLDAAAALRDRCKCDLHAVDRELPCFWCGFHA